MESGVVNLCRLCARNKFPDEIVGQINGDSLDIEPKLIACCRWNTINAIQSDKFPQSVCISCFQALQQCWDFAELVRRAQFELLSKLDWKEDEVQNDNNQDVALNGSTQASIFHMVQPKLEELPEISEIEVQSLSSFGEAHSDQYPDISEAFDTAKETEQGNPCQSKLLDFELQISNNIKTEDDDTEDDFEQSTSMTVDDQHFNGKHFLDAIPKKDRNKDGTIKVEAVQHLKLDNWTLLQLHRCYLCRMHFVNRYEWRNHNQYEHPEHPLMFLCDICNVYKCRKIHSLTRHIISHHRSYLVHCCKGCNTYYWDLKRLKSHSLRCTRENRRLQRSLCDICGEGFRTFYLLRRHRREHLPIHMQMPEIQRVYECYMCKKTVTTRTYLSHHIQITHMISAPKFQCNFCGKEFNRKDCHNRHILIHSNEMPFECKHCSKKFLLKNRLDTHIRTHTGEKPFKCILCTYCCSDSGNMAKHMRQVHGTTKTEAIKKQSMQQQ